MEKFENIDEQEIRITRQTANICQKLILAELERLKILNTRNKSIRLKLEKAIQELSGNYETEVDLINLIKRINNYDKYN